MDAVVAVAGGQVFERLGGGGAAVILLDVADGEDDVAYGGVVAEGEIALVVVAEGCENADIEDGVLRVKWSSLGL